jgi:adenosylcobinamide-GDP ribazoletransferase
VINDIRVAFAFLTRIRVNHGENLSIARSARWFPLVGWVIGGVTGIVFILLHQLVPALPAAAIAILISALITGGFHHDGLADTFDGLVGGWTPADRLRILKDSRHGTYGVLAIVFQVGIQISLLSTLEPTHGALALVTAHTLGRLTPIYFMLAPAAPLHEGMGATYVREVKRRDIFLSTVLTIALLVGLISIHLLFLSIIVSLAGLIFLNYVKNRIGGVVGDVLGASEQIAETVILFYFVFISTHSLGSSWLIF